MFKQETGAVPEEETFEVFLILYSPFVIQTDQKRCYVKKRLSINNLSDIIKSTNEEDELSHEKGKRNPLCVLNPFLKGFVREACYA